MKYSFAIFTLASSFLVASPAVMGGITYNFGSSSDSMAAAGATLKVLSTAKSNKPVVGAGVSYYPWAQKSKQFGLDVSAGYSYKNSAVMGGWDFLKNQPTVSLGYNKEISSNDSSQFDPGIQDARCSASKK
ncbi:MAG TPA: hypothetical protein ENK87_00420 [Nitratifractor sp.]|nr:hypothetical protein [Nitratifractor sp.]HHD74474.1 hypothetical protein [Nitratifractor sp.]HHH20369.1 hypothetical protein [Nitratifractor sp.]